MEKFKDYESHNKILKKLGIRIRGIVPDDPSLSGFRETDSKYGREMKKISPDKYSSDIAIEIGDTFVRFFDPVNLQGFIIENKAITKTMKEVFGLVWDNMEK